MLRTATHSHHHFNVSSPLSFTFTHSIPHLPLDVHLIKLVPFSKGFICGFSDNSVAIFKWRKGGRTTNEFDLITIITTGNIEGCSADCGSIKFSGPGNGDMRSNGERKNYYINHKQVADISVVLLRSFVQQETCEYMLIALSSGLILKYLLPNGRLISKLMVPFQTTGIIPINNFYFLVFGKSCRISLLDMHDFLILDECYWNGLNNWVIPTVLGTSKLLFIGNTGDTKTWEIQHFKGSKSTKLVQSKIRPGDDGIEELKVGDPTFGDIKAASQLNSTTWAIIQDRGWSLYKMEDDVLVNFISAELGQGHFSQLIVPMYNKGNEIRPRDTTDVIESITSALTKNINDDIEYQFPINSRHIRRESKDTATKETNEVIEFGIVSNNGLLTWISDGTVQQLDCTIPDEDLIKVCFDKQRSQLIAIYRKTCDKEYELRILDTNHRPLKWSGLNSTKESQLALLPNSNQNLEKLAIYSKQGKIICGIGPYIYLLEPWHYLLSNDWSRYSHLIIPNNMNVSFLKIYELTDEINVLLCGTTSGYLLVYDPESKSLIYQVQLLASPIIGIRTSSILSQLRSLCVLVISQDNTCAVVDLAHCELMLTIPGHSSPLINISESIGSSYIEFEYEDGTTTIWDMATSQYCENLSKLPNFKKKCLDCIPTSSNILSVGPQSLWSSDILILNLENISTDWLKQGDTLQHFKLLVCFLVFFLRCVLHVEDDKSNIERQLLRFLGLNMHATSDEKVPLATTLGLLTQDDEMYSLSVHDIMQTRTGSNSIELTNNLFLSLFSMGSTVIIELIRRINLSDHEVFSQINWDLLPMFKTSKDIAHEKYDEFLETYYFSKFLKNYIAAEFANLWSISNSYLIKSSISKCLKAIVIGDGEKSRNVINVWKPLLPSNEILNNSHFGIISDSILSLVVLSLLIISDNRQSHTMSLIDPVCKALEKCLKSANSTLNKVSLDLVVYGWDKWITWISPSDLITIIIDSIYVSVPNSFADVINPLIKEDYFIALSEIASKNETLVVEALSSRIAATDLSLEVKRNMLSILIRLLATSNEDNNGLIKCYHLPLLINSVFQLFEKTGTGIIDPDRRVNVDVTEFLSGITVRFPSFVTFHKLQQRLFVSITLPPESATIINTHGHGEASNEAPHPAKNKAPKNYRIPVTNDEGTVGLGIIYDLRTGTEIGHLESLKSDIKSKIALSPLFSPNGKYLAAIDTGNSSIYVWKIRGGFLSKWRTGYNAPVSTKHSSYQRVNGQSINGHTNHHSMDSTCVGIYTRDVFNYGWRSSNLTLKVSIFTVILIEIFGIYLTILI